MVARGWNNRQRRSGWQATFWFRERGSAGGHGGTSRHGLRARGHDVYPITLTGLGERVHLARPEVDLETHIADVVNTIQWNDLDDVILAGHSYAGIVITGVADRIPDRVAATRLRRLGSARGRDGDDRPLPARRVGGAAADGRPGRRGLALSVPRVRGAGEEHEHCRPRGTEQAGMIAARGHSSAVGDLHPAAASRARGRRGGALPAGVSSPATTCGV